MKKFLKKIPKKFKEWSLGYNCLLIDIENAYQEKIELDKKGNLVLH